ncbi:hypothetical protein ERHA55_02570 [Erwinia rhapontici]|nr:hypothetical protein ERHA55_02570 [Erwinia rhapontici]
MREKSKKRSMHYSFLAVLLLVTLPGYRYVQWKFSQFIKKIIIVTSW